MSNVLRFNQFKDKIYEGKTVEEPVNEGIGKFIKNLWDKFKNGPLKKVGRFFVGKGGWLANLKVLQDAGKLPQGIKVFTFNQLATDVESITPEEAGIDRDSQALYGYIVKEGVENNETQTINEEGGEDYVQLKAYKDMPNVDAKELKQIISDSYLTKTNLMIWGAPGIGKTEILKQVAKSHGANVIVVILSLMEPTDAVGLPEIQEVGDGQRRTVTRLPIWYPKDNYGIDGKTEAGGIMFLDEINRANRAVMNSLLTLVQDRKIDIADYTMPDQWVVIAAANREEDDPGNLEEIGSALGNRFQHINYAPETDDWIEWASTKGEEGQNVIDDIVAFITFNKDYLHMLDPEAATELWASPRSWTNASRLIAKVQKMRKDAGDPFTEKDIESIIARNVSPSVAKEFMAFLKVAKQYPLDQIDLAYTNPKKAPKPAKGGKVGRVDTSLALLGAVAFARKDKEVSDDEFYNLIEYADGLDRAELAMPFIQLFFKLHPGFKDQKYLSDKRVADFLSKHN